MTHQHPEERHYPSEGMRVTLGYLKELQDDENERLLKQFMIEYSVETTLTDINNVILIVEIFKQHQSLLPLKDGDKQIVEQVQKLCETCELDLKDVLPFYQCLCQRFLEKKYVLFAYTKDRVLFEIFDLQETVETMRYITKRECGHCRKSLVNEKTLLECGQCKQAAYCTRECQVNDWKAFHKHYCSSLKEEMSECK